MKIRSIHIVLFWCCFALFMTGVMLLVHPITHQPVDLLGEFIWNASFSLAWMLGTPVSLRLSAAYPLRGTDRFRNGIILFSSGLAVSFVLCIVHGLSVAVLNGDPGAVSTNSILTSLFYNIDKMLIVFVGLATMQHAMEYHRTAQEQQLAASQLETQLSQSQMMALKMQLQPHFLFNTLNAIVTLVRKDPDQAEEMIVRLSEFLRITLDSSGSHAVPLNEELRFIRSYLAIEEVRFGGRLRYTEDVPARCQDVEVPMLLLQPLVENAVRHGLSRYVDASLLHIAVREEGTTLILTVEDDAAPAGALDTLKEGIGLSNTRHRLAAMYGERAGLTIAARVPRGCTVSVTIPLKIV